MRGRQRASHVLFPPACRPRAAGASKQGGRPAAAVGTVHARTRLPLGLLGCRAPDENVLGLHVPVDDAVGVQVVKGLHQLAPHAAHHPLGQAPVVLQDVEQLACRRG